MAGLPGGVTIVERVDGFDAAGKLVRVTRHPAPARVVGGAKTLEQRRRASLALLACDDNIARARIVPPPERGVPIDVSRDELDAVYKEARDAREDQS